MAAFLDGSQPGRDFGPLDDREKGFVIHAMDALDRITARVGPAHGRGAVGARQALVVVTLAALAGSAVLFLAS